MEKIIGKLSGDLTGTVSTNSLEIDRVKKENKIRQIRIFISQFSHDDFTRIWISHSQVFEKVNKHRNYSVFRACAVSQNVSNPLDGASVHITKGSRNLFS